MKEKILNNEKGISGIDVGIATVVIIIFVSVITTLFYQIYRVTTETERNAEATVYITRILENIQNLEYDLVSEKETESIIAILQKIGGDNSSPEYNTTNKQYEIIIGGYTVNLNVENYTQEDTTVEDVMKKVIVDVNYKINNEDKKLEMAKVIMREE